MKHPLLDKLSKQLKSFMHELHFDIPRQLEHARSLGDLSENAEYEMTKDRQLFVESRIKQLEDLIKRLQSMDISNLPKNKAGYGSRVVVEDLETGDRKQYLIVFPGEEPPFKQQNDILVTLASPVAMALAGKSEGDVVTVRLPKGTFEWEITELITFHDIVNVSEQVS
ncbi:GreA/GreB family elongation factor [bacterium]|nr:GreA/GreB family elongation factor [candidate division CSSED10-310 bacterium]